MLYQTDKPFSEEEFRSPGKEYRGAPFWAWNCDLDREELLRQIGYFREMGFGGFHMHVRSGLSTPYMSREFLDLIEACVDEAERQDLLAWAYDEDRWPSGFAGGLVTKEHPEFRKRYLVFSPERKEGSLSLLARFDICLNADGTLASYRMLADGESAKGAEWFAQVMPEISTPRYNNTTYVDTLNPRAIEQFVAVTHEKYRERLGDRFGNSIPAIFTDEPQFAHQTTLPFSASRSDVRLVWTDDLPQTYADAYGGEELIPHLPELIWDLPDGVPSVVRYRFHDHTCERFVSAYCDTIGKWCDNAGILFTGHVLSEQSLRTQTNDIGEAMRAYRSMSLPGIDMLCGYHELTTAKQAQSAVRQYGRCGMMSELYGVLGWDLDFRGHKHHGDWQAAMGVTLRVPHLSWVSMKGEAKRDYPQSIFYQSSWYRKYPLIEDHFARLNTVLTKGKARVRVAVVHPIESYWLHFGAQDRNATEQEQLEENFQNVTSWLAFNGIDFDYICESFLPELCSVGGNPLRVGEGSYDAVVVPACETLRSTTLERLDSFQANGGTLIFLGSAPTCVDAVRSGAPAELCRRALLLPFSCSALLRALEPFREVRLCDKSGAPAQEYLTQLREIGAEKWLFMARGKLPAKPDIPQARDLRIELKGILQVRKYDTVTGEILDLPVTHTNEWTFCDATLYDHDSLLLRLTPAEQETAFGTPEAPELQKPAVRLSLPSSVPYRLAEPNVFLIDKAEYALDGGEWQPENELLRIDNILRRQLGWQLSGGGAAQPWCVPAEPATHRVSFRMKIQSEIACDRLALTLEHPENTRVIWNGAPVTAQPDGFFADHGIRTLPLPGLLIGENVLEVEMPFEKRVPLEWFYLLGDFGVRVIGTEKTIIPLPETLGFGSITAQGLPFYGGGLTYLLPVELQTPGSVSLHVPQFRAAVLELRADAESNSHLIAFSPYTAKTDVLAAGKHTLELTAWLNRTNTFGALHNADRRETWLGPALWRTEGDRWTDGYELAEEGILHAPTLTQEE